MHGCSKQSSWSGFGPTATFLQTECACEVIRMKTSKLSGKTAAIIVWILLIKTWCCIRIFSCFRLLDAIPYHDEAHTACSTCPRLSLSHMQSLTSLDMFPKPPSSFPPFSVRIASDSKMAELGNMTTHSVLSVNQNPPDLWSQLRSGLRANFFGCRHALHM